MIAVQCLCPILLAPVLRHKHCKLHLQLQSLSSLAQSLSLEAPGPGTKAQKINKKVEKILAQLNENIIIVFKLIECQLAFLII